MAKDINIPVRADGADEAKDKIDCLTESIDKMTNALESQGTRGTQSTDKLTAAKTKQDTVLGGLISKVGLWAAGMLGAQKAVQSFTSAIDQQNQAIEENVRLIERQQNASLRLQFLGDLFADRPELRKELASLSEFGRRPVEQVADAWYNLRSKSGGLSDTAQMGILREALEMGRTDPSLPLDTLVDMFSLYAKQSGITDANRIQNVLQQTITDAGGSGADVAAYMPQFLPVGMAGGLSPAQTAGLWAYVTTQQDSASRATTGLRATFMGLQGKGTPESQKLLQGLGVTPQMDFLQKIGLLSQANLSLADAEQIAGREGAPIFLSMLKDPAAMMRTISHVTAVDRGDIDLSKTKIGQLFGADEVAKNEEDLRLLRNAIDNLRATDEKALAFKRRKLIMEYMQRKQGSSEWSIGLASTVSSIAYSLGLDITEGLDSPYYLREMEKWGQVPQGLSSGSTVINNYDYSSNLYRSEGVARPRISPGDL